MGRVIAAFGASLVATAFILGPAQALVFGSARAQLPSGIPAAPAAAVASPATAPATAAVTATTPGPNAARVLFTAVPSAKLTQGYLLNVTLRTVDGKPLNEVPVRYYEIVDLFGQREMYIGETTTDGQGDGSLIYLPAQLGAREIIARTPGRAPATRNETRITLDARVAAASYRTELSPLAAFSAVLPTAVGAVVLFVWALLAFALIGTARGVQSGARENV